MTGLFIFPSGRLLILLRTMHVPSVERHSARRGLQEVQGHPSSPLFPPPGTNRNRVSGVCRALFWALGMPQCPQKSKSPLTPTVEILVGLPATLLALSSLFLHHML